MTIGSKTEESIGIELEERVLSYEIPNLGGITCHPMFRMIVHVPIVLYEERTLSCLHQPHVGRLVVQTVHWVR